MPRYTDLALGAGAVLVVGLGLVMLKPDSLPSAERGGDAAATALPGPLRSSAAASSTSAKPSGSAKASASADAGTAATGDAWVLGTGHGLVVRSVVRSCDSPGATSIGVIDASGAFEGASLSGLAAVGAIAVDDDSTVRVLGVDADCEAVGFTTSNGGVLWKPLETAPAIWGALPGHDDQVHAPSGMVDVPCTPVGVVGLNDTVARLACEGGQLMGTQDGGEHWSVLGTGKGVSHVGFTSATSALGLQATPSCDGVEVARSSDGGSSFAPAYCAEGEGRIGLATAGSSVAALVGDSLALSDDAGHTWKRVSIS